MPTNKLAEPTAAEAPAPAVGQVWRVGDADPKRFVRVLDPNSNVAPLGLVKVTPCDKDGSKRDGVVLVSYPPRASFNNQSDGYIFVSEMAA